MDAQSGAGPHGSAPPAGRVHVLGAGPVGLLLTALLQPLDWAAVRLYEKRRDYTRTRMVRLASYLVADSVEAYRADHFDGDNVEAVFDPSELAAALAFRQSIPADLAELLRGWTRGFIQLNAIERALSDLIDARTETPVERVTAALTAEEATAMLEPGDVLIDCTGSKSLLRDGLLPDGDGNTLTFLFEHALVVTFLYSQTYTCNEYCKYYKNVENAHYKFIPMVSRVSYDGTMSHVTGIVTITPEEYAAMPKRFDGEWLRDNLPDAARSMERFIAKVTEETHGEVVGDLEMIPIPLNLYPRATRRACSGARRGRATTRSPRRRCSCSGTRRSARPTSSRSRSASSARCSWRDSSRNATGRPSRCSIATSGTCTSSGCVCTCRAR